MTSSPEVSRHTPRRGWLIGRYCALVLVLCPAACRFPRGCSWDVPPLVARDYGLVHMFEGVGEVEIDRERKCNDSRVVLWVHSVDGEAPLSSRPKIRLEAGNAEVGEELRRLIANERSCLLRIVGWEVVRSLGFPQDPRRLVGFSWDTTVQGRGWHVHRIVVCGRLDVVDGT